MNDFLKGTFICKNKKVAFVYLEDDTKIRIYPENYNNAFDKDEVMLKIIDEKRLIGKVITVAKRNKLPYIGKVIYFKNSKAFIRINKSDIVVQSLKKKNLKMNDLVAFNIDYYKSNFRNNTILVNVFKNFGSHNISKNILLSILFSENIDLNFKKNINNTIRPYPSINNEIKKGRFDLREQNSITIDDISAKDLDDAIFLEKDDEKYTLFVHIADVSFFVLSDSLLDIEAAKRGNSIYLEDFVIPMLPKILSNKLCSLNQNEDKLVFTVKLTYDLKGKLISKDFFKSVINVKHRLSYNQVNDIFKSNDKESFEMLFNMLELSNLIRNKKIAKGMISFDLPEIKLIYDENSNITDISTRIRDKAENLIEDFMIEANIAVSEKLHWQDIPAIYRVHEKPDLEILKRLNGNLNLFGYNISNLSEIHPGKFSKIINESKDDANSFLIHKMILRAMKRAHYSNENLGHFALALDSYLHFTSPIRRYSDLIVHRMLDYSLKNKNSNPKYLLKINKKLKKIAEDISKTEKIAERLEKIALNLKLLDYMSSKINETYIAKINGFNKNKVFLLLDNYIEVVCYVDIIEDEILIINNSKYIIGDLLKIKITKIDYERIEIVSEVIDENISE